MNSRELVLVTAATAFGAVASAFAIRFFLNPKRSPRRSDSVANGIVAENALIHRSPFDPSKRTGLVNNAERMFFSSLL